MPRVDKDVIVLPEYFEYGNTRYYIQGAKPDGKLDYRIVANVRPEDEIARVLNEAVESGVFTGEGSVDSNPNGSVLRSEFIFELWRALKAPTVAEPEDITKYVGEDSYYRKAVAWLLTGPRREYFEDLYNFRDLEGHMTWMELSYFLFALGYRGETPWSKIKTNGVRTSIVAVRENGQERLDLKLSSYKQSIWMKPYITQISVGKRYLPYPIFCMFRSMVDELKILPGKRSSEMAGDFLFEPAEIVFNPTKSDWCVAEISRRDMVENMGLIIKALVSTN